MVGIIVTDSGRLAGSGIAEREGSQQKSRMRKGRGAGAYAGGVESLLKQGESGWEPDWGGGALWSSKNELDFAGAAELMRDF